jgi:4-amino-4-deoxy-L-arabinose transferase-like glycosyltransferase
VAFAVSRRTETAVIVAVLLAAAFLRTFRLDQIPPGLTHDEADTGYFVAAVLDGTPSTVETPYGYAYKPFTQYSAAPFMAVFGDNGLALRYHAAFWGMVLVVFTYLWARNAFGVLVGLGSAALVAFSYWTVADSRFALNSGPAPALFTAGVYFLWRALRPEGGGRRWVSWLAFVLLVAGSLYAYEAALAASASLLLLLGYLVVVRRKDFGKRAGVLAVALAVTALLVAPHLLSASAWGRTTTLSDPLRAAADGDWQPLLGNVLGALGTFTCSGDSFVTYNLPGRPIFGPVAGLLFYVGIVLCLRSWRQPRYAFAVMWIAAGIVPTVIIGEWTSTLHSKAAQAPILALPALAAVELGRLVRRRLGPAAAKTFALCCLTLLLCIAVSTFRDYFVVWGEAPETRAAYFNNLSSALRYLNGLDYAGAVSVSSPFPNQPLDPFIGDMTLERDDLDLRWFDARRALVFPAAPEGLLLVPSATPLADCFQVGLELGPVERVELRPDDLEPYFDVYRWNPLSALALLPGWGNATAVAGGRALGLPVDFGGAVELVAFGFDPAAVPAGGSVQVLTVWTVRDAGALGAVPVSAYGPSGVLFTHLLDAAGRLVAQDDRLDAPAWNWHPGDSFVQLHLLTVGHDARPGVYVPEVGVYNRHDGVRVPVLLEGEVVDDRVLLPELEVLAR